MTDRRYKRRSDRAVGIFWFQIEDGEPHWPQARILHTHLCVGVVFGHCRLILTRLRDCPAIPTLDDPVELRI
jgi:hypothetical protein